MGMYSQKLLEKVHLTTEVTKLTKKVLKIQELGSSLCFASLGGLRDLGGSTSVFWLFTGFFSFLQHLKARRGGGEVRHAMEGFLERFPRFLEPAASQVD